MPREPHARANDRARRPAAAKAAALVLPAALVLAGPARAAGDPDALRREHERCQKLRADGVDGEVGPCFERVYFGLTALDPRASRDLYNVLVDATAAHQRVFAADQDPAHLCRAAPLIRDYLERTRKADAIPLQRKAKELARAVDDALIAASRDAGRDVCEPLPPAPAAPPVEAAPEGVGEAPAATGPAPALKKLPPASFRPYTGRSRWAAPDEPGIELLAAGFGVTLGGAVAAGVGVGLLLYRAECTGATPDCSDAALATYHDAGYLTLAASAAVLIAGASILFADRVQQRRRQTQAAPMVGPGGGGVALSRSF